VYVKQRDGSLEAQNAAAEIKLRAERRLGQMLKETVNHKGSTGHLRGNIVLPLETALPEGISKMQSSRWQQVAAVPEPVFERLPARPSCGKEGRSNVMRSKNESKQRATTRHPCHHGRR
jgi:hypothetical protein